MRLTDDECECMLLVDAERLNGPLACRVGVAEAAATPPCGGGIPMPAPTPTPAPPPPSPLSAGEDAADRIVGVVEEKCTRGNGAPALLDTDEAAAAWGFMAAAAAAAAGGFVAPYACLLSAGDELYVIPVCVVCPFVYTVQAGMVFDAMRCDAMRMVLTRPLWVCDAMRSPRHLDRRVMQGSGQWRASPSAARHAKPPVQAPTRWGEGNTDTHRRTGCNHVTSQLSTGHRGGEQSRTVPLLVETKPKTRKKRVRRRRLSPPTLLVALCWCARQR